MLLPVIGAWVGTVLAFYFGQVNFRAASESAANLVRQLSPREKLQAKPVSGAMMKINEVTTFKIPADKTEADITIRELIDEGFEKDKSRPRQRLPILDAEGRGKYVLHRSTIDAFVAPKKRPPDVDESTLSLKDLLEDPKLKDYIGNSFMPLAQTQRSPMPRIFSTKIRNVSISWLHRTEPRMGLWSVGSRM